MPLFELGNNGLDVGSDFVREVEDKKGLVDEKVGYKL
jgi:hypothetical protein